ncbi:MAG: DUF1285 domain-containing protein [Alphaproteobacteria bacterium]
MEIGVAERFRILADGSWLHDGRPVARPALVRLFASVLRREPDGSYWLVTPTERAAVSVDDAPFVAVAMTVRGSGRDTEVRFRTNVDSWVRLDADHPLRIAGGTNGPRPYVGVDSGLEALIARSVYYDLAARAATGPDGRPGVWSAGGFFALVPAAAS